MLPLFAPVYKCARAYCSQNNTLFYFKETVRFAALFTATLRAKLQKEGDRDESRYDENGYRITARDEAGAYLSHFPATTEIHGEESAGIRRIRQSSDRITNELRRESGKPSEALRTVSGRPLGSFSSYSVKAKAYDHPSDPKQGMLEIYYYGKEQLDQGLTVDTHPLYGRARAERSETLYSFKPTAFHVLHTRCALGYSKALW